MKGRSILIIILFSFSVILTNAQSTNKAGTSSAQFLKIGVGAEQTSMAGATAALVSDESAMYWNPAGLVEVRRTGFYANFTNWFADIQHNYFGFVLPISNNQTIGINATMLTMNEMEVTTELEPQGTGVFFDASDIAIGISYSMQVVDFFSFGTTVKLISQSIYNESASAFAFDIGTKLNTGFYGIKIGMAFTNFGTKLQLSGRDLERTYDPNKSSASNVGVISDLKTEAWELPTNFRVGVGWDIVNSHSAMVIDNEHKLQLALDANHPIDAKENVAVGFNYTWHKLLSVRSGYHFNDDVYTWVIGFGVNWNIPNTANIGVDYAYSELDKLGDVHSFTVKLGL